MKGFNVVLAIVLVAVCLIGWIAAATSSISKGSQYNTCVEQADAWTQEGLYQRAIQSYKEALSEKATEEVYHKAIAAFDARYQEAPEETKDDYEDFLIEAVAAYPKNEEFAKQLANLYFEQENYKDAYACLSGAANNGITSDEIKQMLRTARYAFTMRNGSYSGVKLTADTVYAVSRKGEWGTYDVEEGTLIPCEYVFASQSGDDGAVVITSEKDSRLINGDGIVLGIFERMVVDAGMFSEGLIAADCGDGYYYYDEFAKVQFGGFEEAGAFQEGKAAVKQNGKWFLINTSGEKISEEFSHIVLNGCGQYISSSVVLAAKNTGSFAIYDEKLKEIALLDCDQVDICTEDGLIAICQNGKWGFVNREGTVVIQPQYENARSFSNGLAAVSRDGKWGFIDRENNLVIPCDFSDTGYFDVSGICFVRTDMPENTSEDVVAGEGEEDVPEKTEPVYPQWKMIKLINGIVED